MGFAQDASTDSSTTVAKAEGELNVEKYGSILRAGGWWACAARARPSTATGASRKCQPQARSGNEYKQAFKLERDGTDLAAGGGAMNSAARPGEAMDVEQFWGKYRGVVVDNEDPLMLWPASGAGADGARRSGDGMGDALRVPMPGSQVGFRHDAARAAPRSGWSSKAATSTIRSGPAASGARASARSRRSCRRCA